MRQAQLPAASVRSALSQWYRDKDRVRSRLYFHEHVMFALRLRVGQGLACLGWTKNRRTVGAFLCGGARDLILVMHGTIGIFQSLDCRRRPCVCRIFGGSSACSTARQQKVGSPPGGGITLGNCFSNAPVRCRMVLRLNPTELRSYAIAAFIVTATIIERLHEEHAQVTVPPLGDASEDGSVA